MELAILVALILLNGVFAMSEIAVVSSRRARLQQRAEQGNHRAGAALELARDPGHFLSTIQVGITLVGVLSGAYGGAVFAEPLALKLRMLPWLAPYSEPVALAVVVASITYLTLIFGELAPKRLALLNPEGIAAAVAYPLRLLSKLVYPLVRLLSGSTDLVLRVVGARAPAEPPITDEEIKVLMKQGKSAGVFEEAEETLVTNVFQLDQRGVGSIMTPKPDIVFLDLNDSAAENTRKIRESGHANFPLCRDGIDNVQGIVRSHALLARCLAGQTLELAACAQEPLYVPETLSAMELLKTFKRYPVHCVLIIDEYGDIQGLVTLNDLVEAIVGGMPSMALNEEQLAVRREDGSWLLDGMLPVARLEELFETVLLPQDEAKTYNTLSGFVMTRMGRIPDVADHFDWQGLRFEVIDMDRSRIDKVLVTPLPTPADAEHGASQ